MKKFIEQPIEQGIPIHPISGPPPLVALGTGPPDSLAEVVHQNKKPKNAPYQPIVIDEHTLQGLIRYSSARHGVDAYALPGYFIMTGRNGLEFVADAQACFPACRHPNLSERLLIFPPVGDVKAVDAYLDRLETWPANGVQLARFSPEDQQAFIDGLRRRWKVTPFVEDTLDWGRYPVRSLPVQALALRVGKSFQNHRRKYNYVHKHIENIEIIEHWDSDKDERVCDFIHDWAGKKHAQDDRFSLHDYASPYLSIVSIHSTCDLRSVCLLFEDAAGRVLGMVVVEILGRVAATYMNIATDAISYLPTYILIRACEYLHETQAADVLCLGGSETESLNRFKANAQPDFARDDAVLSYELQSFLIQPQ